MLYNEVMPLHLTSPTADFLRRAAALSASLGHYYLGVEHVMLAALALDEAAGVRALDSAGLPAETFVQRLRDEIVGYPQLKPPHAGIPVTPRLARVLEAAAPDPPLDLPALLKGITTDPNGLPARLARALGGDPARLGDALARLAQAPPPGATAPPSRLTSSMAIAFRSRKMIEALVDDLSAKGYTLHYDPAIVGWLLMCELESDDGQGALDRVFADDLRPRLDAAMRQHPPGSVFSLALGDDRIDLLVVKGALEA